MELENIRLGTILEDVIVADILLQQSVKCLMRLKCVSKSWCSFISSKKFVKTHSQKLSQYRTFLISLSESRKHYVIDHYPVAWLFRQVSTMKQKPSWFNCPMFLQQSIEDDGQKPTEDEAVRFGFDYPTSGFDYPICDDKPSVVGCCNGLCCMLVDLNGIILWNPSTRKSYRLPAVSEEYGYPWIKILGFGYDESNDDFKVLVAMKSREIEIPSTYVLRFYSLKTDTWKTVDNFLGPEPPQFAGVLMNGKFHWGKRTFNSFQINAFDLERRKVELVEQPSSEDGQYFTSLGVLQGRLYVLCKINETQTRVWVMKEYGVKESWCKLATIPCVGVHPLLVCEEDKILFSNGSYLFVYNPIDDGVSRLILRNFEILDDIGLYVQSLVSPFPDERRGGLQAMRVLET